MMCNFQFLMEMFTKNTLLGLVLLLNNHLFAEDSPVFTKLPQATFLDLISKTVKFEVNDATAFKHTDLPKSYHNAFLSYIKDSSAIPQTDLKSRVYYTFTLSDGRIINGDIYWNSTKSYIIFKIENKTYVNYFTTAGITQIKTLFKL